MKRITLFFCLAAFAASAQGVKVSELPAATSVDGTEVVPIVQTTTKKATIGLLRGFNSYGTVGQLLRVNGAGTGLEFFTPSYLTGLYFKNGLNKRADSTTVELGGALIRNTSITGDFDFTMVMGGVSNSRFEMNNSGLLLLQSNTASGSNSLSVAVPSAPGSEITINQNKVTIQSSNGSFEGLQYAANYSSTILPNARSIADVGTNDARYTPQVLTANLGITQGGFNTNYFGTGKVTFNSVATRAGLNVGTLAGGVTSNQANGDIWYNSTTNLFQFRQGGATVGFMNNPMTTGGDIIYGGASGVPTRLANGSSGQILTASGGTSAPTWATPAFWKTTGTTTISGVVQVLGNDLLNFNIGSGGNYSQLTLDDTGDIGFIGRNSSSDGGAIYFSPTSKHLELQGGNSGGISGGRSSLLLKDTVTSIAIAEWGVGQSGFSFDKNGVLAIGSPSLGSSVKYPRLDASNGTTSDYYSIIFRDSVVHLKSYNLDYPFDGLQYGSNVTMQDSTHVSKWWVENHTSGGVALSSITEATAVANLDANGNDVNLIDVDAFTITGASLNIDPATFTATVNDLTFVSENDISIASTTGDVQLDNIAVASFPNGIKYTGAITLVDSTLISRGYARSHLAGYTFTNSPSTNYVPQFNGTNITWAAGGSGITNGAANTQLMISDGTNAIGDLALTFDGTNDALTIGSTRIHTTGGSGNTSNLFAGNGAGNYTLSGTQNVAYGVNGLNALTSGVSNVAIGSGAVGATSGSRNIGIGGGSAHLFTTGNSNIVIGVTDFSSGASTGSRNILIGGYDSGSGVHNSITGSNNISLGHGITLSDKTASDRLVIQNAIYGSGNSGTGTTVSTGNVGFWTNTYGTSAAKVIAVGNGTAPSTSTSDAFQIYSADVSAGNAALHTRAEGGEIISLGSELGTQSNHDLVFVVNGSERARIPASTSTLTDGGSITITSSRHKLTTDEATITFTNNYTGDQGLIEVTFNTTASTWTFPSGALCEFNGTPSTDNTMAPYGASGDKILLYWENVDGNYYYTGVNKRQ
jgi:hypothetical protein